MKTAGGVKDTELGLKRPVTCCNRWFRPLAGRGTPVRSFPFHQTVLGYFAYMLHKEWTVIFQGVTFSPAVGSCFSRGHVLLQQWVNVL